MDYRGSEWIAGAILVGLVLVALSIQVKRTEFDTCVDSVNTMTRDQGTPEKRLEFAIGRCAPSGRIG
ncbi:hypothetical protein ASC68_13825 [Devosia sp. Root105]|nr:hypothetical protein ASC68_13825 [Devosia sp. Root105]